MESQANAVLSDRPATGTAPTSPRTHGAIMAIGGGEDKLGDKVILSTFVESAGGRAARIAIVPTASSSESAGEGYKSSV